jgi:hypothetical protein
LRYLQNPMQSELELKWRIYGGWVSQVEHQCSAVSSTGCQSS